jgi:hypothetical protein
MRKTFSRFTTKYSSIQKVLQSETLSLSSGDHFWFMRRSAKEKWPVTRDIIIIIQFSFINVPV